MSQCPKCDSDMNEPNIIISALDLYLSRCRYCGHILEEWESKYERIERDDQ